MGLTGLPGCFYCTEAVRTAAAEMCFSIAPPALQQLPSTISPRSSTRVLYKGWFKWHGSDARVAWVARTAVANSP